MSDHQFDPAALEHDIASCAASHASLIVHLREQPDLAPATPSSLPDWTVGHVLSHIARNGDSMHDLLAGRWQYPSVESRNADIEQGSRRPWPALVADVAASASSVDAAFEARADWGGAGRTLGGDRPHHQLPLLRQREVEVHRADLGLGYGFDDMPIDYVRRDLRMMEMLWSARQPMGMTTLPPLALAASPSTRLAWLMGRVDVDGLDPAGLF